MQLDLIALSDRHQAFMAREDIFLSASTKDEVQDEKEIFRPSEGEGTKQMSTKNKEDFLLWGVSRNSLESQEQCIMSIYSWIPDLQPAFVARNDFRLDEPDVTHAELTRSEQSKRPEIIAEDDFHL